MFRKSLTQGSIAPNMWGPAFWETMHWSAAGYPDEPTPLDKLSCKRMFTGMMGMLPCPTCREHFATLLKMNPIEGAVGSGHALRAWTMNIHNAVNVRLQSGNTWTIEQINRAYPPPAPGQMVRERQLPTTSAAVEVSKQPRRAPEQTIPIPAARPTPVRAAPSTRSIRRRSRLIALQLSQQSNFTGRIGVQRSAPNAAVIARKISRRSRRRSGAVPIARTATTIIGRNNQVVRTKPRKKKGCGCGGKK